MSDNKKPADDLFEDGLRHILSNDGAAKAGLLAGRAAAYERMRADRVMAEQAETEKRIEAERKVMFWLNLLRPVALAALLGLMVIFVARIVNFGN